MLSQDIFVLGHPRWYVCSFDPMTSPSGRSRSYEAKFVFFPLTLDRKLIEHWEWSHSVSFATTIDWYQCDLPHREIFRPVNWMKKHPTLNWQKWKCCTCLHLILNKLACEVPPGDVSIVFSCILAQSFFIFNCLQQDKDFHPPGNWPKKYLHDLLGPTRDLT